MQHKKLAILSLAYADNMYTTKESGTAALALAGSAVKQVGKLGKLWKGIRGSSKHLTGKVNHEASRALKEVAEFTGKSSRPGLKGISERAGNAAWRTQRVAARNRGQSQELLKGLDDWSKTRSAWNPVGLGQRAVAQVPRIPGHLVDFASPGKKPLRNAGLLYGVVPAAGMVAGKYGDMRSQEGMAMGAFQAAETMGNAPVYQKPFMSQERILNEMIERYPALGEYYRKKGLM